MGNLRRSGYFNDATAGTVTAHSAFPTPHSPFMRTMQSSSPEHLTRLESIQLGYVQPLLEQIYVRKLLSLPSSFEREDPGYFYAKHFCDERELKRSRQCTPPAWRAWCVVPISEKILIRMTEPEGKLWGTKAN
jgi:hypothetical protein